MHADTTLGPRTPPQRAHAPTACQQHSALPHLPLAWTREHPAPPPTSATCSRYVCHCGAWPPSPCSQCPCRGPWSACTRSTQLYAMACGATTRGRQGSRWMVEAHVCRHAWLHAQGVMLCNRSTQLYATACGAAHAWGARPSARTSSPTVRACMRACMRWHGSPGLVWCGGTRRPVDCSTPHWQCPPGPAHVRAVCQL